MDNRTYAYVFFWKLNEDSVNYTLFNYFIELKDVSENSRGYFDFFDITFYMFFDS
jgi:hypothetical protein